MAAAVECLARNASEHKAVARIDWAVLCDLAFFDRQDRLSIIGVIRTRSAPTLPMTLHQAVLVARLADIQHVDEWRSP